MNNWDFIRTVCWAIACVAWYYIGKKVQKDKCDEDLEKQIISLFKGWADALNGWSLSNEKLRWAYEHLSKKNQKLYDEEFKEDED